MICNKCGDDIPLSDDLKAIINPDDFICLPCQEDDILDIDSEDEFAESELSNSELDNEL